MSGMKLEGNPAGHCWGEYIGFSRYFSCVDKCEMCREGIPANYPVPAIPTTVEITREGIWVTVWGPAWWWITKEVIYDGDTKVFIGGR